MNRSRLLATLLAVASFGVALASEAAAQTRQCSVTAIQRWHVEGYRWSNGTQGGNFTVDFAKGQTVGGTPVTVTPRANGVEFSFVHTGSGVVARTASYDMTAQDGADGCKMVGNARVHPGNATATVTMRPRR